MLLQLSTSNDPLNVSFSDASTGQLVYEVSTNSQMWTTKPRISKVHRVVPSKDPNDMQNRLVEVGTVEHHAWHSSIFHFGEQSVRTKDFFRKDDSWRRGSYRHWTASDGNEYAWDLGASKPPAMYAVQAGERREQVVTYHRSKSHFFSSKAPELATFEISPTCYPILDEIIVTHVYIQKKKNDQAAANAASASSASSASAASAAAAASC